MKKLNAKEYKTTLDMIDRKACGAIYPLSVAEGRQHGDIYTDGTSLLVWHYCGFAFLRGECGEGFLNEVYDTFLSPNSAPDRRFFLFAENGAVKDSFLRHENIIAETRLFFEYKGTAAAGSLPLPEGFALQELSSVSIGQIQGRITPHFSWDNNSSFLAGGRGYYITDATCGGKPAAWAFSAAVSSEELDIGVETAEEYRNKGLASAAAAEMIKYALATGKRPVWACHKENEASRRLAERLGFVNTAECFTIKAIK